MRFDTPVFFQRITAEYNEKTGDYDESIIEEKRYASVTDSSTETVRLMFGELRQGVKTIRLQAPYTEAFNRIRIGDKRYSVNMSRHLRTKHTLIVSEVQ
jgi:hypothetical protein